MRCFAGTGGPPARTDLEKLTAGSGRSAADILVGMHERDVIRLDAEGIPVVAYPFSAVPTTHKVRVAEREVYAMCAIDALGIAHMLAVDSVITSPDASSTAWGAGVHDGRSCAVGPS
jgi:hypothetical protein